MSNNQKAACLCGKVSFEVALENNKAGICHCDNCRKISSSFYNAVSFTGDIAFKGEEFITVYNSSEWAERGFCNQCGSNLFYRLKAKPEYHISAGIFENYAEFELATQIFIDCKSEYLTLKAETKNMTKQECFDAWG